MTNISQQAAEKILHEQNLYLIDSILYQEAVKAIATIIEAEIRPLVDALKNVKKYYEGIYDEPTLKISAAYQFIIEALGAADGKA